MNSSVLHFNKNARAFAKHPILCMDATLGVLYIEWWISHGLSSKEMHDLGNGTKEIFFPYSLL